MYSTSGQPLSVTPNTAVANATIVAKMNPLRYRGYYYDTDTGFYYLQSRYYDPSLGRFINADSYSSTGQGILGNNMYTYCGNNPRNRTDTDGDYWHIVIGAGVGAIANGLLTVLGNIIDNDSDSNWYDGIGLALLTGAVTGGFAVSGCGPAVLMAVNAGAAAVEGLPGVIEDINKGESVGATLGGYALDVGFSAITSYSGSLGSKHAANLGKQTIKRTWNAFVHDGFAAGFSEIGKAAKWYWKSAKTLIGSYTWEQIKDAAKSAGSTIVEKLIEHMLS